MSRPEPRRWHTREDSGLRLDRNGQWWHDDEPVEHPKIVEVFNRGLVPTENGRFRLNFGDDWCFVQVDDAAYRVRSVERTADGALRLSLSDGTNEALDPETLAVDEDGVLSCLVKQRRAKAAFERSSQFELGDMLEEREGKLFLRHNGRHFPVAGAKTELPEP